MRHLECVPVCRFGSRSRLAVRPACAILAENRYHVLHVVEPGFDVLDRLLLLSDWFSVARFGRAASAALKAPRRKMSFPSEKGSRVGWDAHDRRRPSTRCRWRTTCLKCSIVRFLLVRVRMEPLEVKAPLRRTTILRVDSARPCHV